ncbi:MAG TPA: hypothetical protein VLX91_05405 [Candidatus Acidoferrales bacterium]|nr:hypothetical protein [Candidatus Acidoferrales bacterium]
MVLTFDHDGAKGNREGLDLQTLGNSNDICIDNSKQGDNMNSLSKSIVSIIFPICLCVNLTLFAQSRNIEFDSTSWNFVNAKVTDFQGKRAMTGAALLKDVVFTNGIIETDLWVDGSRSYPTIAFRFQSIDEYEHVYVRPHRAGLYDDAIQYAPAFNGQACWQLYYGKGCTAGSDFSPHKWLHLKLVVKDTAAQFFIDDMTKPALDINTLAHGISRGAIGLSTNGSNNYFSNFKLDITDSVELSIKDRSMPVMGNITDWEISKSFSKKIMFQTYPYFYSIYYAGWEKIEAEENGLVNISRYRRLDEKNPQFIWARSYITSDADRIIKVAFAYSDQVKVFLNQMPVYSGDYGYRSRGNAFTGALTLSDTLYLNLRRGLNEIFLFSSDAFGGWGFAFESVPVVPGVRVSDKYPVKLWETAQSDFQPESVLYDSTENMIYYSQFDNTFSRRGGPTGYITKVNMKGEIVNLKWADSLYAPTGMCKYKDKIYVAERKYLTAISVKTGKIIKRYPFPDNVAFPNDVDVDGKGNVYITNSASADDATDIYVFKRNHIESWMKSKELSGLNGILLRRSELIVGNQGKGLLEAIDINTKTIRTIASIGSEVVDGIEMTEKGDYLVSNWYGSLYKVTESGDVVELLNSNGKFNIANFAYISNKKLLLVPNFLGGTLQAYEIEQ